MANVKISKRGLALLRNKPLAEAVLMAIVNNSYTPSGDAIVVLHEGKKFLVTTASYPSEQERKNRKK